MCIGSIDRTCKIWNVKSGQCVNTLRGHNDEILDVAFNANGTKLVTASADGTSRVYSAMTGACQAILIGHEERSARSRSTLRATRSSPRLRPDVQSVGRRVRRLPAGARGAHGWIFSAAFNYEGDTIITGSKDACRIWKC